MDADLDLGSEIDKNEDGDMPITIGALAEIGISAQAVAWDDESFDWANAAMVIVRSTWDYHRHIDRFLRWIDVVSQQTYLENSADVIRWNVDKRYLGELERAGFPVIETVFIEPNTSVTETERSWLDAVERLSSQGDVVVKPVVSAGSNDTRRHAEIAPARAHIDALLARGRSVMVQPYVVDVDIESETGLVYIDGEFSHAFFKGSMLAAPGQFTESGSEAGDLYLAETIGARTPTAVQRDLGDRVMSWLMDRFGKPLYARIDMLPGALGPVIIEVELAEPSLYLHLDARGPQRFAEAIRLRLSEF